MCWNREVLPSSHGMETFLSSKVILWCLEGIGWASALVMLKVRFLLAGFSGAAACFGAAAGAVGGEVGDSRDGVVDRARKATDQGFERVF